MVFLSLTFHHQIPACTFPLPYVLLALFYLITCIIFDEEQRSQSSSLCNLLQLPVALSLLCPSVPLSTLFSNTLGLCSSFRVRDKVSFAIHNNRTDRSPACFRFSSFLVAVNYSKHFLHLEVGYVEGSGLACFFFF